MVCTTREMLQILEKKMSMRVRLYPSLFIYTSFSEGISFFEVEGRGCSWPAVKLLGLENAGMSFLKPAKQPMLSCAMAGLRGAGTGSATWREEEGKGLKCAEELASVGVGVIKGRCRDEEQIRRRQHTS